MIEVGKSITTEELLESSEVLGKKDCIKCIRIFTKIERWNSQNTACKLQQILMQ